MYLRGQMLGALCGSEGCGEPALRRPRSFSAAAISPQKGRGGPLLAAGRSPPKTTSKGRRAAGGSRTGLLLLGKGEARSQGRQQGRWGRTLAQGDRGKERGEVWAADGASPEPSGRQRGGEAPRRSTQEIKRRRGPWSGTDVSARQPKARALAPAEVPGEGRRQFPFPRARPGRTASKAALLSGCSTSPCSRGPGREEEQTAEAVVKCCGCPLFWSIPERFPHFYGKVAWVLKKYRALQPLLSAMPAQSRKANDGMNLYLYVELRTSITVSKPTFNCYFESSLTI